MSIRPPVLALLQRWQELQRIGKEPSPEELCKEQPEFLSEIRLHLCSLVPLNEKFRRWRKLRLAGQAVSPEALCQDAPELLPLLLRQIDRWETKHAKPPVLAQRTSASNDTATIREAIPSTGKRLLRVAGVLLIGMLGLAVSGAFYQFNLRSNPPVERSIVQFPEGVVGELRCLRGHTGVVSAVALSPDSRLALTGSADRTMRLWLLTTGRELRSFAEHTDTIRCLAFSSDGRPRACPAAAVNFAFGMSIRASCSFPARRRDRSIKQACFSSDGRPLLSWCDDGSLQVWNLETNELVSRYDKPGWLQAATFSASGQAVALGGGRRSRFQTRWELEARQRTKLPLPLP